LSKVKDITVRAGENIKIALPLKGWPVPTASWQHGDKDIYKDDRNNIEVYIMSFSYLQPRFHLKQHTQRMHSFHANDARKVCKQVRNDAARHTSDARAKTQAFRSSLHFLV